MTSPRRRTTEPSISDEKSLRVLYFGSFVGAAFGSLLLSLLPFSWVAALWATLWMAGYLMVAYRRAPSHVTTEQFADNYYYFGFLLTLVSLCGVLLQLGLSKQAVGDNLLRVVLSQFGLALVTTILGLVVRTALLMHRGTLDDAEERAEAQMAQAFDSFVHSLDRLSAEADAFSQGFAERLKTILTNVEVAVGEFGEAVRTTSAQVKPLQDDLKTASTALQASAGDIGRGTKEVVSDLKSSTGQLGVAFTALAGSGGEAVRQLAQAAARLQESVESAEAGVRQPLDSLENQVSKFGHEIDRIAVSLGRFPDELTRAAATAGKSLEPMGVELAKVGVVVRSIQEALGSIARAIQEEGMGLGSSVRSYQSQVDALARIHAQLIQESEGAGTAILQVRRDLAAGVEFLINTMQAGGGGDGSASH